MMKSAAWMLNRSAPPVQTLAPYYAYPQPQPKTTSPMPLVLPPIQTANGPNQFILPRMSILNDVVDDPPSGKFISPYI